MDSSLLSHLLALVARTGDRIVVVDPATRRPFVLMDLPQYEALLEDADARGLHADERGSETPIGTASIIPGTDAVAQRANAEFAAWRAEQPADVAVADVAPVASAMPATVAGFAPEPLQSATSDSDRFYVEPIE